MNAKATIITVISLSICSFSAFHPVMPQPTALSTQSVLCAENSGTVEVAERGSGRREQTTESYLTTDSFIG